MLKNCLSFLASYLLIIPAALAQSISFSEIFPNPDGTDKEQEWIEFQVDHIASLKGWSLENNGKSQEFNQEFNQDFKEEPTDAETRKNLLLLPIKNLKNKENTLKILSPEGKIVEELKYQNAPSGKSFSKIQIITESKSKTFWRWNNPTPGENNHNLFQLEARVTIEPNINSAGSFQITNEVGAIKTVYFENSTQKWEELKSRLKKGKKAIFLLIKAQQKIFLEDYKILREFNKVPDSQSKISPFSNKKPSNPLGIIIIIAIFLAIPTFWLSKSSFP